MWKDFFEVIISLQIDLQAGNNHSLRNASKI